MKFQWLMAALLATAAHAQVMYDYSGYPTAVMPSGSVTPAISGDIVLAAALNPNELNQIVTPLSYSFADMLSSNFEAAEPYGSASFSFSTNQGQVVGWNVNLYGWSGPGSDSFASELASITSSGDTYTYTQVSSSCSIQQPDGCFTITSSNTTPGSWVDPPLSTPELHMSGSIELITLLVGLLAVLRGRRPKVATYSIEEYDALLCENRTFRGRLSLALDRIKELENVPH
jgi:hypothetical protein